MQQCGRSERIHRLRKTHPMASFMRLNRLSQGRPVGAGLPLTSSEALSRADFDEGE
jgi:hypothetical protein